MSDYELRIQVVKKTSDKEEFELEHFEYALKDSDVDGIVGWIKNLFGAWFWS